ncbi:hypothetical protein EUTSA_v10015831mg [Eutrema salsugineum]|uniref:Uncharacterized protein n=1 Tax=Eutrema salsugineum TaxID=72664 RepID=V4KSK8_EUTSA|nr:elicitor peptide 5 [Eutrema salsugineum]ESQ40940.1 hypothetical protein EUTSA_v10015831mg [Eutrema salsugineum]
MQQERDNKKHCCKLISQTVVAFFGCLNPRRSSSSSSDMVKAQARTEEEEASPVEISTKSLNMVSTRRRKPPVSSGKRGGVNNYVM